MLYMEFAWNTQKNKMSDVKGKEMEQDRKGRLSNKDIDLDKTHLNFDFIESNCIAQTVTVPENNLKPVR